MIPQTACNHILGYFLPADQEIIRFMASEKRLNLDKLSGRDMLVLIEDFEESKEWQAAMLKTKGAA